MTTAEHRRGRRAVADAASPAAGGIDLLSDFGREQMAMAMDASCSIFRGFEAMRAVQQEAARQASARHEAAARQLRETSADSGLMSIPFGLWQADLASASRYWQELAGAALETQAEIMSSTCRLLDAQTTLESASAMEKLDVLPGVRSSGRPRS